MIPLNLTFTARLDFSTDEKRWSVYTGEKKTKWSSCKPQGPHFDENCCSPSPRNSEIQNFMFNWKKPNINNQYILILLFVCCRDGKLLVILVLFPAALWSASQVLGGLSHILHKQLVSSGAERWLLAYIHHCRLPPSEMGTAHWNRDR